MFLPETLLVSVDVDDPYGWSSLEVHAALGSPCGAHA